MHPRPPFTPSLGLTPGGEYLNVNADDLAAALTTALRADRLLYVTESGGVWDAERRRLPVIKVNEIPTLIRKGVVRDGMILKLRSCARTLATMSARLTSSRPQPATASGAWSKTGRLWEREL